MAIFYTNKCVLCQHQTETLKNILCDACEHDLSDNKNYCYHCARPQIRAKSICGKCLTKPPAWHQIVCFCEYQGPVQWLIKQLKYNRNLTIAPLLASQLSKSVNLQTSIYPSAIIPMPLHWTRYWTRGFNQAKIIADQVSAILNIPVINKGVSRKKLTPALEGLTRKQRRAVMRNVFQVNKMEFDHVAVIDDVLTTGASAESLVRALKKAGVRRVDLWVIARTP